MYAACTVNSYTVTYDYKTNGGTSATKTTDTVEVGDSIDLTPTATKSGYTFVGWNTSSTATTALDSLEMGTDNVTLYAIFKKTVTGTFYYYNSGIKNTTASCTMYNTATSCSITVPTSTFSSTTSQYGASYVGYGAVNTMGTSTATSVTISANTSYYASYREKVTEYYQGRARAIYRNAFFTSSSAMSTVLSTSTTGTSDLTTAGYTTNSINWSWYGYSTSSLINVRVYSSVFAAARSTATTLYTMYSRSVSATFYYYDGSSQATTTGSGTQLANYKASVVSNGNITVPTTVTNSSGPSSTGTNCSGTTTTNTSSYYGVSSSVSSTTTTTPKTNVTKYYAIYKSSFSAYYNKGVGINTIGSTTNSCTNYKTTNGTTYSSSNCNVTLPAITALDGYVSQGWFKGTTTSISSTTGLSPSTSVNLTTNACYTARSRYLRADELIYDNTLTGEDCDTAQCMIDRINELIDEKEKNKLKNIKLNNNGATSAGTTFLYGSYNQGIYLDSSLTKKMTTSSNPITVPTKTGYTFAGYYTNLVEKTVNEYEEKIDRTWRGNADGSSYLRNICRGGDYTFDKNTGKYSIDDYKCISEQEVTIRSSFYYCENNTNVCENMFCVGIDRDASDMTVGFESYVSQLTSKTVYEASGTQLINQNGYITNNFTNTYFDKDATIYAKWQ